jgi:hypothetical protein
LADAFPERYANDPRPPGVREARQSVAALCIIPE